ncbi:helicase-related protein [Azospirillum sp.]|uniref:helicase-related protein n=1 Tax=Azospirillum sp. TaxID=34012 RepID=UPI003D75F42B
MSTPIAILFFAADESLAKGGLPPGARWITVRPNGPGTEGHAVLIQQQSDGSARVIGGAGGKLNYLRLTGVRSETEYKEEARKKAEGRRAEKKAKREQDRKDGLLASKTKARDAIKGQLREHEVKFVQTVATALGWKQEDMAFPEHQVANLSETAQKKARERHARELFRKAQEAVDTQRQRLVQDAEARSAAGLGEVKLTSAEPDELSVQDLAPLPEAGAGLGFQAGYGKRAEAAGLTPDELKEEAAAAKPPPKNPPAEGQPSAAEKRKVTAEKIAAELKDIREPGPKVDPKKVLDARQAVELLKAEKALKTVQKSARDQLKRVDDAKEVVEPKAYVLEVGNAPVEADVVKDLENDLRTLKTRAFLEEVGRVAGGTETLGKHIGVGAYNSINSVALAAGGASLVDRSVVDVLGVAGAAQVLARRLGTDLTAEEMDHLREAMARFHVDHYMGLSDQALREARELHEVAHEIEVGEAKNGADLVQAQELNAKRREFVEAAQRTLGTALGEMEANAALVVALEQPTKDQITVSLGKTSVEEAIRQARAIGLDRGDYQVERVGASTMLTVHAGGMNKLAQPVAKEDLERTRTALAIINGEHDEDDWLPEGVARRPDMAMEVKPGAAPRLAKPFPANPSDIEAAIRDYIGGRTADGDAPADVMAGLLSEDTLQKAGDRQAFMEALERVTPLYGADGKMVRAESYQSAFEGMADDYVAKLGGDRTPLHRQQFPVDQVAVDALHRALSEHPDGVAAFKPVGELTAQDQRALREAFVREFGKADPQAEQLRQDLEKLDAAEPEREVEDMFGRGVNPAWTEWQGRRNELAAKVNAATMDWGKYIQTMGGPANAYAAMQDVVKSKLMRAFADHHNRLRTDGPLKIGRTVIANDLSHLDALDADARDRRLAQHRDLVDGLRNRVAGRYASGAVSDKIAAARAAQEAAAQAQMGLFGASEEPPAGDGEAAAPERPLDLGERYTLGHAAERQVAGMMPVVGRNFRAGQPVQLWQPTMSGRFVGRQRAVKLIEHNRRVALAQGVGSGKTSMMLAGFTHLHAKGKARRGLFVVPSIVQGQFHGEALTLLQPGKYSWHCDTGASREERIAAYKDPSIHFSVVTHQAFRDDLLHMAAQHEGSTPNAVAEKLDGMTPAERKRYMRGVLDAEGIDHDYLAIDEGHNLLNRAGKQNSRMANVIDAVSHNMGTYVNATADPVKNDPSEAFDVLAKMDPDRYHDRDAFMRKYGVNTAASKDALRREMARHFYPGRIESGVQATKTEVPVQLSDGQRDHLKRLDDAVARARMARMKGDVDVEAVKTLSPSSFEGVPEAQHQELARHLQANVGIIHGTAVQHAINGEAKTEVLAKLAGERRGRPGVVFVNRLDRVDEIADRLRKDGHRVVTLTGGDTSSDKDRKKREYQRGDHDIIVCSNAGAVGANLQRGKWLAQYDTPMTAMVHAQRNGRIDRIGQTEDVELLDLVADHPAERRARKRLADKYELRDIMTSPLEGLDDRGIAGYLHRVKAGQMDAAQPHFLPAAPHEVPDGLAEPEAQAALF